MHDLTSVGRDGFGDQVQVLTQGAVRGILIRTGQARVVGDIRIQDGSELAWQTIIHHVSCTDMGWARF